MKKTLTTVLLTFALGHSFLYSQIIIDGNLRLGDTSQVLFLHTKRGDQLVGSISGWDADSLAFKMATGDKLTFNLQDLDKITTHLKPNPISQNDIENGLFSIRSDDGKLREGHIIKMSEHSVRIKYNGKRRAYIKAKRLEEVVLIPSDMASQYGNNYVLRLDGVGLKRGQLLHIDREYIHFRPYGSAPKQYHRSQIIKLDHKEGFAPMTGHQRALLLTPTGFNLRKGESEYRNINYILNSFSTGFSDHISGSFGLILIEPYFQLKFSQDFGQLLHLSLGGGLSLAGAAGWQTAVSYGTPDYFLNLGFMQNKGQTTISDTDMHAVFFGGSMRVGDQQRLFGEFIHLIEKQDLFDANGYGTNTFAFGYGWFGRRVSLNLALMLTEATDNRNCFGSFGFFPCDEENFYFVPAPIISISAYFGSMQKKH